MKKCPVCGVSVKPENLARHIRNRHPKEDVDLDALLTVEERRRAARLAQGAPTITPSGLRAILVVAVVLALVFALVAFNPFGSPAPPTDILAPNFSLPATTGETVSLASFRGQVVFLEFMDIDCPHCEEEAAQVLRFVYVQYSSRVVFLSIDVNFIPPEDTPERIEAFRSAVGSAWPYLLDENSEVTALYGVTATPTAFVVDRDGRIVERMVGRAPDGIDTYAAMLDAALEG